MIVFLHKLVLLLSSFTASWVVLSTNPVYSVISLIWTFIFAATLLVLFKADFLALIFIVVYVGAIAILFLFVVMMIDIKERKNYFSTTILNILIFCFVLFFGSKATKFAGESFGSWNIDLLKESDLLFNFDSSFNASLMAEALFNIYYIPFLLAGILLLIALLGAILLTLNFNRGGLVQDSSRQLSRSDNFLKFLS